MTSSLPNDVVLRFLEQMITIRAVEQRLLELFSKGHLNGTVHTCVGQEACAVGLIGALDLKRDILFSNHRGHGHYLSYCDDVEGLIAEIIGHPSGVCQGIGGSQHVQRDNFYTNGIQGAGAPIVAGMALAEKQKGSGAIGVVHMGDGTFGEGAVYEALNIASLWNLPMIFAVEHNRYAQTTPFELQHAGDLAERGRPFGIDVHKVDGMDVIAVHETARTAIDACRSDMRPQIVFMETYRFGPHSKGDDHRDLEEINTYKALDPIPSVAKRIGADDQISVFEQSAHRRIDAVVAELIGEAV